jgi:alpha-glucosidase
MPREQRESLLSDVPFFDRDGVHEIYRNWRKIFDSYSGDRMSVAEAWVHPSSRATLYVRPDELHQIFNFDFLIAEWDAKFLANAVEKTLQEVAAVSAPPTWVLSNHDSPRLVSRMGGGELGEKKARAIALLTHALPGGVYVFQGEELGLPDAPLSDADRQDPVFFRTKGVDKGRDGARVPLPWDPQLNQFGFTSGKPWLPIPANWIDKSVEAQKILNEENRLSFLRLYQKSLQLRKLFADSNFNWLIRSNEVIGFSRGSEYAIYSNTSGEELEVSLPESFDSFEVMICSAPQEQLGRPGGGTLQLPPHSTTWVKRLK